MEQMLDRDVRNTASPIMSPSQYTPKQLARFKKQVDLMLAEKSFYEFVKQAWHVVEPGSSYMDNWHVKALCDHLQAVTEGRVSSIIINIPIRSSKSIVGSVLWPAWVWARDSSKLFLCLSSSQDVVDRDSVACKQLVESVWYQERWGDRITFSRSINSKTIYKFEEGGGRQSFTITSNRTGLSADYLVVDDPIGATDANKKSSRDLVNQNFGSTWVSRMSNATKLKIVVMAQRLHEEDLTGYLLENNPNYKHLCIPMRYDESYSIFSPTCIGWEDPRSKYTSDEIENNPDLLLMWPDRWPEDALRTLELNLGPFATSGQLQQLPSPADGGIIKAEWLQQITAPELYKQMVTELRGNTQEEDRENISDIRNPGGYVHLSDILKVGGRLGYMFIYSWDTAATAKERSDLSVGQLWMMTKDHRCYLLDECEGQFEFPTLLKKIRTNMDEYLKHTHIKLLIEEKSSGISLIQVLTSENHYDIISFIPKGDKLMRLDEVSPFFEKKQIFFLTFCPNLDRMFKDFLNFPNCRFFDRIDSTSMCLKFINNLQYRPNFGLIKLKKRGHC